MFATAFILFDTFAVLHVDCESLGRQESEPLQGLRVKANFSEGIVPVGQAEMHNHQPKVVRECVGDKVPLAGQVLEPDLGLDGLAALVDKSKSAVFDFAVDFKSTHFFALLRGVIVIRLLPADRREREMFPSDAFDVPQLVQVHLS